MPDPRTELYNVLIRRLTEEMVARDEAWADYWQRRRVVVVPDDPVLMGKTAIDAQIADEMAKWDDGSLIGHMIKNGPDMAPMGGWVSAQRMQIVRDCIARLKAAREKEAVNKNLSTLLAVVVKVQRDLEALLNGEAK